MVGEGKKEGFRQQSQTGVAVVSRVIIDEDNRRASVQEATCVKAEHGTATAVYVYFARVSAGEDTIQDHLA